MSRRRTGRLLAFLIAAAGTRAAAVEPLLIEGKKTLFQRVITRPGATLSKSPSANGAAPIPGFEIFYVYARDGDWVEVGRDAHGDVAGWTRAAKTIAWQHTMIGAFTNPAGRGRALFLRTAKDERDLIGAPDAAARAAALRDAAASGKPSPVLALEPANLVDIERNFYLLPILDAQPIERDTGPPIRLLDVVSAPSDDAGPPRADPDALRRFKAGLVFVIDTTESMQPYIEQTRAAINEIVGGIRNSAVRDNVRVGLVAYRDSLLDTPALEYATRIYAKPDFGQPIDAVEPAIANVHDARASSLGFDEDPIGGIKAAIDGIDWSGDAGRYMILVTDSGARTADNPHSVTHLGIDEIHELLAAKGIALFVIHLLTPEGEAAHDHTKAAAQYHALSRFGAAGSLYFPVPGGAPEAFRPVVQALSLTLLQQVADTTGRPVAGLDPQGASSAVQRKVAVVSQAMRLAYMGREEHTAAPDIVESFTADRDLADPLQRCIDVRVLLTRNQLSDLAQSLQAILQAGFAGRTEPQTFFTQLRSAFAAAARDPSRIAHADRIGAMLGEYLDGLPYKSDVMNISETDWLAMGAIAQRTVLNNVESRLRLYQEYASHPDLWVELSGSHDPGEAMYPVPIEALP